MGGVTPPPPEPRGELRAPAGCYDMTRCECCYGDRSLLRRTLSKRGWSGTRRAAEEDKATATRFQQGLERAALVSHRPPIPPCDA
jgi:hypothetical protein